MRRLPWPHVATPDSYHVGRHTGRVQASTTSSHMAVPARHVVVPARVSLAGNPSDGFGGAVLAVPAPGLFATATFELAQPTLSRLVDAAAARFGESSEEVRVETTIPRSVGLAGSTAIIISVLELLNQRHGRGLSPTQIAQLANETERTDLTIAGGYQDATSQARWATAQARRGTAGTDHAAPLLMDFSAVDATSTMDAAEVSEIHPTRPIELILAWDPATAQDSGDFHSQPIDEASAPQHRHVRELHDCAQRGAEALRTGDAATLGACMNRSFDLRCEMLSVAPRHRAMIERARATGAWVNSAGSGGCVVGLAPTSVAADTAADNISSDGLTVLRWTLPVSTPR